ncbi:MAG: preprotein translocase subunit SecE [Bacteroidetes bacterium]|nr:preprotein translocase subunit SecE [Bacteroidota bacterium]
MDKIKTFFTDIMSEMSKVTWPTPEELRESTVIVLVFSLVFGTAVYAVDTAFSYLLKLIF